MPIGIAKNRKKKGVVNIHKTVHRSQKTTSSYTANPHGGATLVHRAVEFTDHRPLEHVPPLPPTNAVWHPDENSSTSTPMDVDPPVSTTDTDMFYRDDDVPTTNPPQSPPAMEELTNASSGSPIRDGDESNVPVEPDKPKVR